MSETKTMSTGTEVITNGICYMCTASCDTRVHVTNGRATQVDIVDPATAALCPRGKAQLELIYHPDRLLQPLKREGKGRNGALVPTSWDDALDIVAKALLKVKKDYGPESVVFWIAYTKEPRPFYHRLAHAFGSPNYCTESSNCFTSQRTATAITYGQDYALWMNQSHSIDPSTKCKIIWGCGIKEGAPYTWQSYVEAKKNGLKLIVIDPVRTQIASMADIHLQLRPGTDGALALGMINIIISEKLYDKEFMEKWTVGFDDLKKLVKEYPIKKVEQITGVPASKIKQAAQLYAKSKPAQIYFSGDSTTHHSNGLQNHRAIIVLPALTGNIEIKGGNCAPPECIPTNDITLHDRISSMPPGLGSDKFPIWTEIIKEMQSNVISERIENAKPYPIKALVGAGLHPEYFANSNRFAQAVKTLDFVVVTDYFQTAGTQLADVVLPISSWLERHILLTWSGGAKLIQPAIEPVGQTWPEWKIYFELAKRLGLGKEFWDGDLMACFNYMLEPSGITVNDLKQQPDGTVKKPVVKRPEKYYEQKGFKTPSGKVEIVSSILAHHGYDPLPVYKEPVDSPLSKPELKDTYPLVLTTGARRLAYTHSQFRNISPLRQLIPDPVVDIHPSDAKERKIETGDFVMILSPGGSASMKANVTDTVKRGVVSAPHHWPREANINAIISDKNFDPVSGFAPLKSSLCNVMRV